MTRVRNKDNHVKAEERGCNVRLLGHQLLGLIPEIKARAAGQSPSPV